MVITIRFNQDKHKELCEILSNISGTERADYIRKAIQFYATFGQRIENIEKSLLVLVEAGAALHIQEPTTPDNTRSNTANANNQPVVDPKILNGIADILNLS